MLNFRDRSLRIISTVLERLESNDIQYTLILTSSRSALCHVVFVREYLCKGIPLIFMSYVLSSTYLVIFSCFFGIISTNKTLVKTFPRHFDHIFLAQGHQVSIFQIWNWKWTSIRTWESFRNSVCAPAASWNGFYFLKWGMFGISVLLVTYCLWVSLLISQPVDGSRFNCQIPPSNTTFSVLCHVDFHRFIY